MSFKNQNYTLPTHILKKYIQNFIPLKQVFLDIYKYI